MASTLKIVDIKPKDAGKHPAMKHQVLPQHEFGLLIVAPKGSGKTNLICNLLLNHFKGYFHQVLVCSPTVKNDPKWEVVKATKGILAENKRLKRIIGESTQLPSGEKKPKIVHASEGEAHVHHDNEESGANKFDGQLPADAFFTSMEEIEARLQKQNDMTDKLIEMGHPKQKIKYLIDRVLLIEDDQAGLYRGGLTNNPEANFVFKHRHYGASLIKVTQKYKAMPSASRTQMDALICFEIGNRMERDAIYDEWDMGVQDRDDWMDLLDYATAEPYGFIYMNKQFPRGKRIYKNFEQLITVCPPGPTASPQPHSSTTTDGAARDHCGARPRAHRPGRSPK